MKSGDIAGAIGDFIKAGSMVPGTGMADRGLGEAYFTLYRREPRAVVLLEKAKKHFERAILASPGDMASLVRLYHVRAFEINDRQEELERILHKAAKVSVAYPRNLTLRKNFVEMAIDLSRIPRIGEKLTGDDTVKKELISSLNFLLSRRVIRFEDIDSFTERVGFDAGDLLGIAGPIKSAVRTLALDIIESGRWDREGPEFLDAGRVLETSDFHMALSKGLSGKGRRVEALEVLVDRLRDHPREADVHFQLARISLGLEGYGREFADRHLREAVELAPLEVYYRLYYAMQFYKRAEYERSIEELKLAAGLDPDHPRVYYYLGLNNDRLDQKEQARGYYQKALELSPENEEYRQALKEVTR